MGFLMADYTAEIEQLESVLNGAVESISVDGLSTKVDLDQARKRLNELRNLDEGSATMVRPTITGTRLGGAW